MFNPKLLITARGEIDRAYLVAEARLRAARSFGGDNPPVAYVRPQILNLEAVAYFERRDWRRAQGLRDDTDYVSGFTVIDPKRRFA